MKIQIKIFPKPPQIHQHRHYLRFLGISCADPEGGGGGGMGSGRPLKSHKNVGFLSNSGPDPLKNHKLPSQYSMLGHHRLASEMPFKWRFTGWLMMAQF